MLVISGMVSIMRCVEGVIEGDDDGKKPSNDGQNLVREYGVLAVGFALGERVDCTFKLSVWNILSAIHYSSNRSCWHDILW